jgi:hypothetical protein
VTPGFVSTGNLASGKRVNIKLGNAVTTAYKSKKLPFCRFQGSVWHHVEKTDVQLAYRLVLSSTRRQHLSAFGAVSTKTGQLCICN